VLEGGGVCPFSERGLNEALSLAVSLRGVRLDLDVLDAELLAGAGEGFGEIAAAIVGHDALDDDAEGFEVADGCEEESNGTFLLLVREDIGTGDTGMVVDGNVDEFPAGALAAAMTGAASGDPVADAVEAAKLLDVEMDDLAGLLALVAWSGSCGSRLESRLRPHRLRMRETLALEMPSSAAMCSWV
jgi:hypothetical protein